VVEAPKPAPKKRAAKAVVEPEAPKARAKNKGKERASVLVPETVLEPEIVCDEQEAQATEEEAEEEEAEEAEIPAAHEEEILATQEVDWDDVPAIPDLLTEIPADDDIPAAQDDPVATEHYSPGGEDEKDDLEDAQRQDSFYSSAGALQLGMLFRTGGVLFGCSPGDTNSFNSARVAANAGTHAGSPVEVHSSAPAAPATPLDRVIPRADSPSLGAALLAGLAVDEPKEKQMPASFLKAMKMLEESLMKPDELPEEYRGLSAP
jgi:hypothetical protein